MNILHLSVLDFSIGTFKSTLKQVRIFHYWSTMWPTYLFFQFVICLFILLVVFSHTKILILIFFSIKFWFICYSFTLKFSNKVRILKILIFFPNNKFPCWCSKLDQSKLQVQQQAYWEQSKGGKSLPLAKAGRFYRP